PLRAAPCVGRHPGHATPEGRGRVRRARLARLHRALARHRGPLRARDGRRPGSRAALHVLPDAVRLHRRARDADMRRVVVAGLGATERRRTALVVGAVGGGMLEAEAWYWRAKRSGAPLGATPELRSILPYSHADVVGSRLGLGGPRETLVTACSSGAVSLAVAADLVADGVAPVAVAGGTDALTRICFMGFNALRLLDPEPCRPFDAARRGMSIGEGAGFVVLEDAVHAGARGARIYAEL